MVDSKAIMQLVLNDIWGFRENGEDWICRNGELYEVVNHEGIWIYQKQNISDENGSSYYYFSESPTSNII